MTRPAIPLATFVACCALAAPTGAQPATRAFVLDTGAHALVALDLASGKRLASLPLTGAPTRINQSDDGRYVVLLDLGPGEDKNERGYKATGRSSVTVVDTESLKIVGRAELGSGIQAGSSTFLPDGRMAVVCPGYEAKNPAEALVGELVIVDLGTARETGRLPLAPGTFLAGASRDRRTLVLLQGLPRTDKFPYPKSKLTLVDVAGPSVAATLDTGTWGLVQGDGERFYLLDPGRPDKNPQKNRNGAIEVVSLADRHVEHVDIGRSPAGAALDDPGGLLVPSEGPAGGMAGELRVLRAGVLATTVAVAARPRLVQKAGAGFYVVGSKDVTLLDAATLQVTGTIPLAKGAEPIVDDDDWPTEMAVTTDGRRAFIHYGAQHKVAVLDLEHRKAIGSTKTGRGGKKFLNSVMSGLDAYLGYYQFRSYRFDHPAHLQLRPDGRFAYALNLETNDVTVVDADSAEAVEKIGGGGNELLMLGGPTLVVVGSDIHLIDAARNVMLGEIRLPGLRGMLVSPDGAFAVSLAERTVLILDAATGKERARLTDFANPTRISFGNAVPVAAPTTP